MSAQVEEALKRMFAAFGKKPFKEQWDEYLNHANRYDIDTVVETIEKIILNDEKLPTIKRFHIMAKSIKSFRQKKSITAIDDCWLCQATGYVPYLYPPNEISRVWYTRNMGCKCSRGEIKHIPKYFHQNQKLQFDNEADKYPDMAYPQIVDKMKMIKNSELKS